MTTMTEIEIHTKAYADAREALRELVAELEEARRQFVRQNLPKVRRRLERVAELEAALKNAIEAAPHLFIRPRSAVFHGIKVGMEKGAGKLVFQDAQRVVELIEKKLPDMADVLIITSKAPNRKAIAQLTIAQLKSLGASIEDTGDRVVIRAVAGDVDKLVTALLRGMVLEGEPEATAA